MSRLPYETAESIVDIVPCVISTSGDHDNANIDCGDFMVNFF